MEQVNILPFYRLYNVIHKSKINLKIMYNKSYNPL